MNGIAYKNEIERIFKKARDMCPGITDDMLDTNGAIYYMNGNDSTQFDWAVNERLCEFYIFHANNMGFIKAFVFNDDSVEVYIYEHGEMQPTTRFSDTLVGLYANEFANLMYRIADSEKKFDVLIDSLDWDVDTDDCLDIAHQEDYDTYDEFDEFADCEED